MTDPPKKSCFVICPIGDPGSEVRTRSDEVLESIIRPAVEPHGYARPVRADAILEPGIITSQIVQHLLEDDLVVADLTDKNANVFYELAIRHLIRKPIVQIMVQGGDIPFDVFPQRTCEYDLGRPSSVKKCSEELGAHIAAVEKDPASCDNLISQAIDLRGTYSRTDASDKVTTTILSYLQAIHAHVSRDRDRDTTYAFLPKIMAACNQLARCLEGIECECAEGRQPDFTHCKRLLEALAVNVAVLPAAPGQVVGQVVPKSRWRRLALYPEELLKRCDLRGEIPDARLYLPGEEG